MEETVQGRTEEEQRGLRRAMKQLGGVFDPIIPGIITAGLAAGFGGAFIMATEVASASWGPSGLLALPMMTAGPHGAVMTAACYLAGLAVSCVLGFLFTHFAVRPEELADK